jgi:hypothetical protein
MQGLAASQEFEVVTHAVQAAQFFLVEPSAEIEAGFATQQFARDFHRTQLGTKHGDARMDATGNADRRVVDAERGAADAQLDGSGSDDEDEHSAVVLVPTGETNTALLHTHKLISSSLQRGPVFFFMFLLEQCEVLSTVF